MDNLYSDDNVTSPMEQFISYIMRDCLIPTYEEAEEAFAEGLRDGSIKRVGGR